MTAITLDPAPAARSTLAATLGLDIRRTLRNRRYLMLSVAFPVVFYLLYTAVLPGNDPSQAFAGTTWGAFFMVSMAAYGAIGAALSGALVIAVERSSGWTRQLRTTPLEPSTYLASKILTSLVTTVPAMLLVMGAAVVLNGVRLDPLAWAQLVCSLTIGALPFAALGVLIGYLFDAGSAQGGMMISYFTLAILGGLWTPLSKFPDVLATIGHVLPGYHFANLGWDALTGHAPDLGDVSMLGAYLAVFAAMVWWRYRADVVRTRA